MVSPPPFSSLYHLPEGQIFVACCRSFTFSFFSATHNVAGCSWSCPETALLFKTVLIGNIPCICDTHIKTILVKNYPNYHHSRRMDHITNGPHHVWTASRMDHEVSLLAAPNEPHQAWLQTRHEVSPHLTRNNTQQHTRTPNNRQQHTTTVHNSTQQHSGT